MTARRWLRVLIASYRPLPARVRVDDIDARLALDRKIRRDLRRNPQDRPRKAYTL